MSQPNHTQSMEQYYSPGGLGFQTYSRLADKGLTPEEMALIRAYCPDPNAAICNVGCGEGRETFALHDLGYRNVQGMDLADSMLEVARRRCAERNLRIAFTQAPADRLPFAAGELDVLTMFCDVYGLITPQAARIAALTEARRVLKPGGVLLMNVISLRDKIRYYVAIRVLEILRAFYNPWGMERGDKHLRGEPILGGRDPSRVARSHWFRPGEVPAEAMMAGLEVILQTTSTAVQQNPRGNSHRLHKQRLLVYVLRRPAE